ncbi:MAG: T9SS type A sorting domain-containing protein, partial [Ignavibacterium sp.]
LNVLYSNLINQSGYLLQATAISPDGRYIVGKGYRPSLLRYEAYLLDRGISTEVEELNEQLPQDFVLQQNYPNPFNPNTTISFSIPEEEFVTLKVFNSLGEEVAELINENKPAGTYEVEFTAASLPSGVYFYKLKAGSFVETKKMILIK